MNTDARTVNRTGGGMVTAYGRVSTDKQDERSQREIVNAYAAGVGLKVDAWKYETISSQTAVADRELAGLIDSLKAGDTLIVSELSRLARGGSIETMAVVEKLKAKKARLIIVDGLNGSPLIVDGGKRTDPMTELFLAMGGMFSNMERTKISERTRAALTARKAAGVRLGRPTGTKLTDEQAAAVRKYLSMGIPKTVVAKLAGVTRGRLLRWLEQEKTGR